MASAELQLAVAHHRAGRMAEAEAIYRQIVQTDTRNADAWHLLGVLACQRAEYGRAIELIGRALALVPSNAEFYINLGEAQRRAGVLDGAIASFGKAAELQPENVYPWYNLGVVLATAGRGPDAIEAYKLATECVPTIAEAHNNLGGLLYERGNSRAAADNFRKAIALLPTHAEAHNNLGLALWRENAHLEALASFEQAAAIKPTFAAAHANAAAAFRRLGRREEAAAAFQRAANLDPASSSIQRDLGMMLLDAGNQAGALDACVRAVELAKNASDSADAHHALGVILARKEGGLAAAVAAYEKALALKPQMEEWNFELAAIRGVAIQRAPDAFVKTLFDAYAWQFEKHLVEELGYRVPEELLTIVAACTRHDAACRQAPWDIIDLGCGTGRCAEIFRPSAKSIVGVDLSPNMIEAARRGGRYDTLEEGHILPALQRRKDTVDLILAADVFIYVGALEEIFAAAARSLRKGGLLAFSLEHHEGEGFILHRQYRFAHSPAYVRRLAVKCGLVECQFRRAALRADVPAGWIVVLQKP